VLSVVFGFRAKSIKTRIETFLQNMQSSPITSFRAKSIKTRIETGLLGKWHHHTSKF